MPGILLAAVLRTFTCAWLTHPPFKVGILDICLMPPSWDRPMLPLHIFYMDLLTIFLALQLFFLNVPQMMVSSGIATIVALINHLGTTRSKRLFSLISIRLVWCS